jgi:molybdate transport system ATP-binding protein
MTVIDNVAFGPRCDGKSRAESRAIGRTWLRRFGLEAFADAKPRTLSGGQAQLVALARALASEPKVLLLDEPLAALDAGTRIDVRRDLVRFLADFDGPTVLVTHDPVDAFVLADRVVVIEHGAVTQQGTIAEISARPASRYVADLVGTNLIRGTADGTTVTTESGVALVIAEPQHGPVLATIAPGAITLHADEPSSSARNRWQATVQHVDALGTRVRVQFDDPLPLVAEVTEAAAAELGLFRGAPVWASVKATEIVTYPT